MLSKKGLICNSIVLSILFARQKSLCSDLQKVDGICDLDIGSQDHLLPHHTALMKLGDLVDIDEDSVGSIILEHSSTSVSRHNPVIDLSA